MKPKSVGLRHRCAWASLLAAAAAAVALGTAEQRAGLRAYVECGSYDRDIARVAAVAVDWLQARAAQGGERMAAVFDLDETLLSNLSVFQRADYDSSATDWTEWEAAGEAPLIAPVADLLRAAHVANVEIVLLTGRRERQREVTLKNLRGSGIDFPFELILKPANHAESTKEFKERARRELTERGAIIILNIGDQATWY